MDKVTVKSGVKNFVYTSIAQVSNLILNSLLTLIVPMFLNIEAYSYWQLFFFYASYSGFFQFGLNDGVYLRYGGKKYDELDKSVMKSQLVLLVVSQIIISIVIFAYINFIVTDGDRGYVLLTTAVCIIITGITTFFWHILQATNRIKEYAKSIMIDKILLIVFIAIFVGFSIDSFKFLIAFNLFTRLIGLLYCCLCCKDIIFAKTDYYKNSIKELGLNVSSGIKLMLSNISSMLILGSGKMIIDKVWGVVVFGKVSFAVSLTNFILLFVNQISIVIFPTLKKLNEEELKKVYSFVRELLNIILLSVFLFYIPAKFFVGLILPKYSESMIYFMLVLPLCTFSGKMQLLFNTYMKVLREEGKLLFLNAISVIIAIILCAISAWVFDSIVLVVISMTVTAIIRSIMAEIYLSNLLNVKFWKSIIIDVLYSVGFIIITLIFDNIISFCIYLTIYLIYMFLNRKNLKTLYNKLISFMKRKDDV